MQGPLSSSPEIVSASHVVETHWLTLLLLGWLGFVCWALWVRTKMHALERRRERLLREELEAYARLDASMPAGSDVRALAKTICRMVTEKSAFRKAALLLRDAEDRLYCAASAGMDDLAVEALGAWAARFAEQEREQNGNSKPQGAVPKTFTIALASVRHSAALGPDAAPRRIRWGQAAPDVTPQELTGLAALRGRAVVVPLRVPGGRMSGALAVSVDLPLSVWSPTLDEALPPLETLAVKLGRALERAALTERMLRMEKLAGLGQLAGGVAHELNNPLTAVLGFAELIAETSAEPRVRDDAHTIVTEALRMKEIIQNLVTFWRPAGMIDNPVDLGALVRELAETCEAKLRERGVTLELAIGDELPIVRGSAERLRVVLEHLLNNAAQAIDAGRSAATERRNAGERAPDGKLHLAPGEPEEHVVRVAVSLTGQAVHVAVSDSGPGFREPTRVFDPFYTTRQPGEGAGLGLSICYGIVREHGGEISAFNLHPHGAAVVVELPVRQIIARTSDTPLMVEERR